VARQLRRGMLLIEMLVLAVVMTLVVPPTDPADAAAADILVADLDAGGPPQNGPGRVVRLSDAGAEIGGYSALEFIEPSGIALAPNGDLLVADAEAFGGGGGVIRINPSTGAKVTDYQGGNFIEPTGVAALPSGEILVVDQDAFPSGNQCDDSEPPDEVKFGCGAVIKIDPATKAQTRFDSGVAFWNPSGIAIAPDGSILVADLDAPGPGASAGGGPGRVFRLNSAGARIAEYSISGSIEPSGVAVDSTGDMFVVDAVAFAGHGGVFRLNSSGQKIREYFGGDFDEPTGIALAWNGDILVADQDAGGAFESGPGGIIRVNRDTAAQTTYFSGSFVNPSGVTVEPGSPPGPGPGPSPTAPSCQKRQATLSGTAGKDNLKGTPVRDVISGLGGNDTVKALGGHDRVCGGSGKDKISGGSGKDRLNGEAGNDRLIGGPGADRLVGGKGRDTCIGGPGIDKAIGCEVKLDIP
jgi:Ca2+-binding RTX toxin-like protein